MIEPQTRRVRLVVCRGEYCNLGRRADALLKRLEPAVAALNDTASPHRIRLETANCLSMCERGPNCVIYPDDIVFNRLGSADVDAVINALQNALGQSDLPTP
jgi:(2Fe-2S) ferredoxin